MKRQLATQMGINFNDIKEEDNFPELFDDEEENEFEDNPI